MLSLKGLGIQTWHLRRSRLVACGRQNMAGFVQEARSMSAAKNGGLQALDRDSACDALATQVAQPKKSATLLCSIRLLSFS